MDLIDDQTLYDLILPELEKEIDNVCCFKDCLGKRVYQYFCIPHHKMIKKSMVTKKNNIVHKRKQTNVRICAAKRCKRQQTIDSYLCFIHETDINHSSPCTKYKCRAHDCNRVKRYKSHYCVDHDTSCVCD